MVSVGSLSSAMGGSLGRRPLGRIDPRAERMIANAAPRSTRADTPLPPFFVRIRVPDRSPPPRPRRGRAVSRRVGALLAVLTLIGCAAPPPARPPGEPAMTL